VVHTVTRSCHALLEAQWAHHKHVCVGIDPDPLYLPTNSSGALSQLRAQAESIIKNTAHYAAAYKCNSAYFESLGCSGWQLLEDLIQVVRTECPDAAIILDAKRGDVEHTNMHYARMAFEYLQVDAVTVSPWLGFKSLQPFFDYTDKSVYVLCRTSNTKSEEFQKQKHESGVPLFAYIAQRTAQLYQQFGNAGLVAGTHTARDMHHIRRMAPDVPLLIPGVGVQGVDLSPLLHTIRARGKPHFLVSASRMFATARNAEEVQVRMQSLHEKIVKEMYD
jgi:orotidine-5'-phosphate decarboxylase